jgi:aspartate/tyrosine/aromatic aminotransferase
MISRLKKLKSDPILGLVAKFKKDIRSNKINLTVGEFVNNNETYKFDCIKNIEQTFDISYKYLPITGCPEFIENSRKFVFNETNNLLGYQTLSGTGSLWLANQILKIVRLNEIVISNITWPNHHQIFNVKDTYNQYDINSLFKRIEKGYGEVFLFQTCCHNPTGIDYSEEEWNEIFKRIKRYNHIVILDNAYQGLASGNPSVDNYSIRLCNEMNIPFIVCSSYAKNFGLYNQRLGNLFTNFNVENLDDYVKKIIRTTYSNPPSFGTLVFNKVYLENYNDWSKECKELVDDINIKRHILYNKLSDNNIIWDNLKEGNGLFYLTPLNENQIDKLRDEKGIYMLRNGRINIAGLNDKNMDKFVNNIKYLY